MGLQLRAYQQQASDAAVKYFLEEDKRKHKYCGGLLVLPTGCHARGYRVVMFDGSLKKVEDVRVGDKLLGVDSTPRTVIQLHHGVDEMYKVTPIKGDPFVVNGGHILSLYKTREGSVYNCEKTRIDEISVTDYVKASKNYKHLHKLYKSGIVEFGNPHSVCSPYLLGLYLGDGSTCNGNFNITTMRTEVAAFLCDFAKNNGLNIRKTEKIGRENKAKTYYISDKGKGKQNIILEWLRWLELFKLTSGDKFIPDIYKTASISERFQLLAGLLDTDAFYDRKRNSYEYCTKSWRLANDIVFLCRSLGLMCNIGKPKVVNDTEYYRMNISGNLGDIPVKVAIRKGACRKQKKNVLVTGFSVEHVGNGEYYGFTLDGDHLYMDEQFFVHHNSGKSHILADIAHRLNAPILIFAPSKELLLQDHDKMERIEKGISTMYSASVGQKMISMITFATIGSAIRHIDDFDVFRFILVDEAHDISADGGMYERFIHHREDRKVVGLTATPFRLERDTLKFLTRTRPRIFGKVLYACQVTELISKGYLADPTYFDLTELNMDNVRSNSTGSDYDDASLTAEYERSGFYDKLFNTAMRVLHPKNGIKRKGILVFTRFTREAEDLVRRLAAHGVKAASVSAQTPSKERSALIKAFKDGRISVVVNVFVLGKGFDYPELDTIILARPTKSLAIWYQACLDMQTEILTKRGFMGYQSIKKDDLVAAYKDGEILFVPIQEIIHRNTYEGEKFVTFQNQHIDFKVTGDHKMLTKSIRAKCEYKKSDAIEIFKRKRMFAVPVSGCEKVNGVSLSDDDIRFLGWCVSDGSLSKCNNAIHIVQSLKNKCYIDEIERILTSCRLRYSKCIQKRKGNEAKYADAVHFIISHGEPRKKADKMAGLHGWNKYDGYILGCKTWSEMYEQFNEHQFEVFLEAINMADGSHPGERDWKPSTLCICGGVHKNYCDRLQSLALRRGYRAKISTYTNHNGNKAYWLYFKKTTYATIAGTNNGDGKISINKKCYHRSKPQIELSHKDEIWCVRNEIGTIVTRRNGKVLIMGNCGRLLRPYPNKCAWVIDLSGSYRRFGKISDLKIGLEKPNSELWAVFSKGRKLTNSRII